MSDSNDTQAATVERRSSQLLGPALSIVDAGPISALAFLVGLVAGLFFGSPLPVMIAMAAALLAVALRLSSPRVWRLADEYEATKKIDLPPDTTLSDPAAKAQLARIVAARTELDEVLSAGPTDRREVRRRLRAVRDLERAAVAALRRLEFFANAPCDGHGRAPTLEERDAGAVPAAGQLLGRAAAARAERQEALEALGAHRLQQLARLEYLTCCLEAIPAELMELRAMEAEMVDRCRPDPVREADQLRDELQHLRREMASLLVSETKPVDRGQDDGADHRPHA